MNNTQLDEPGLLTLLKQEPTNQYIPNNQTVFKGILVINPIDKVKNCPLTKFLETLKKV